MKLKFNKDTAVGILTISTVLFALTSYVFYNLKKFTQEDALRQSNNVGALLDTVAVYKNKVGDLTSETQVFMAKAQQLEILSDSLYNALNEQAENVRTITTIETLIKTDTVYIQPTDTFDGQYHRLDSKVLR